MAEPIIERLDVEKTTAPMILILGQTGAGKSHFCNRVLGDNVELVKESARLMSCTSRPEMVEAKVDANEYILIDTPGFNDTWKDLRRSDARILGEIGQTLALQQQLGVKLRGILYLYDISAKRMTGDTMRQFELIKRICGEQNYGNVLLVTTHWPERGQKKQLADCAIREGDLRREFWSEMIRGGSPMCRFDDKHSTAKAIIRLLSQKDDITLALQDELAQGKGMKSTSAFAFIVKAREKDEERLLSRTDSLPDYETSEGEVKGVAIRKEDELELHDDLVARIQKAIAIEDEQARKQKKKATVINIFRWLVGLAGLAMGAVQLAVS